MWWACKQAGSCGWGQVRDIGAVTMWGCGRATIFSLHDPARGTCALCRGVWVVDHSSALALALVPVPCSYLPKILWSSWPHSSCLDACSVCMGPTSVAGGGWMGCGAWLWGQRQLWPPEEATTARKWSLAAMLPQPPHMPRGSRTRRTHHGLGCPLHSGHVELMDPPEARQTPLVGQIWPVGCVLPTPATGLGIFLLSGYWGFLFCFEGVFCRYQSELRHLSLLMDYSGSLGTLFQVLISALGATCVKVRNCNTRH